MTTMDWAGFTRRAGCGAAVMVLSLACSGKAPSGGSSVRPEGGAPSGGSSGNAGSANGGAPAGGSIDLCLNGSCGGVMIDSAACGDGALTSDEACDDGNTASGDGCSANCLMVEVGYSCAIAGQLCAPIARCGDGVTTDPEFCDDGNTKPGDGCSPRCTLELGYKCAGNPSTCTATTCGDSVKEGAESCDDGNADPYDGCSALCQTEPNCKAGGACVSDCGDGLVINEECDDGNTRSGDGCSDQCKVEAGFKCEAATTTSATLTVPIVYRDFREHQDSYEGHPNFHWSGFSYATPGIAQVTLDADGKPQYSGVGNLHVDSQDDFKSWYRDSEYSKKFIDKLVLTGASGVYTYDNSAFFPLDGRGWAADTAHPETLYAGDVGAQLHNFAFTSEVHYWFSYDAAKAATLSFRGDDDVWVFVSGRLVVDLGGVHGAVEGSVVLGPSTVDTANAPLNLVQDKVYEVDVFQAERNPTGSNYKLSLGGFNANPSLCTPVCGDGILSIGEQCDDGKNLGGYGKCAPGCVLTEYCGDGIVQPAESCDDGNHVDTDECNNACRDLITK